MFNCAAGREEHCKQISLACVGSAHSVWATLGLPLLMACLLSWSTLLRLQVALQGNCLRQALGCMHFLGLNHSGSGSWVLHKGVLCPSQVGAVQATRCLVNALSSGRAVHSYDLPHPSCSVSWVRSRSAVSGVCVSPLGS